MEIKAVRMFDHGFMNQAFAFGGEEGKDKFDEQIIYRSSLQNFLIDTGSEAVVCKTFSSTPGAKSSSSIRDSSTTLQHPKRNSARRFIWAKS